VGNAGCPLHPRPRVRYVLAKKHTSKRVHRNRPAFPHAMVLTVSFALSPVIGLVCHRHQRIKARHCPVGLTHLRRLDAGVEASGPHDFAVRWHRLSSARLVIAHGFNESALRSRRAQNAAASTASRPASVTMANAPLWDGTAAGIDLIWDQWKQEYFSREDWTGQISLKLKENFFSGRTNGSRECAPARLRVSPE
jgi:hypothetical protein